MKGVVIIGIYKCRKAVAFCLCICSYLLSINFFRNELALMETIFLDIRKSALKQVLRLCNYFVIYSRCS